MLVGEKMKANIEIIKLDALDVITTSGGGTTGENETPDVGGNCVAGLIPA